MKKIILSVAILSLSFANAQDKEVKAAFTAVEAGDMSTANAQISAAESKLNGKTFLLEPTLQEQYLYTKGMMLLTSGKTTEGAAYLAKITDLGKNKIYSGKDASKNKVYYVGKAAADASGISGLKEEMYIPTTPEKLRAKINPILQTASKDGVAAYNAENFKVAGDKFKEVYYLLKAAGQDNGQYLYNAALSYGMAKDMGSANEIFTKLIDSGYTGVETTYTAKNKATGQITNFEKPLWELSKKDPNYSDFKSETSKSIESDIYDAAVKVQIEDKKYDQALATIEKGLKKFPNNAFLMDQKGVVYNLTGKTAEFTTNIKNQLLATPHDAKLWYNLGVMQSKDEASKAEAKKSYLKALELDPKMTSAYQNLTILEMGDDVKTIADYEALKKAGKMDAANEILKKRKARFVSALPYAEKWYEGDSTSLSAVSLLKIFYQSAGNEAKYKEFKAKEAAMEK